MTIWNVLCRGAKFALPCAGLGLLMLGLTSSLGGCVVGKLIGGVSASEESQRLVETRARYDGLENHTLAVLVQVDPATAFESPGLAATITGGITARIGKFVHNAQVLDPQQVLNWQYRTPQWNALPLGDLPEKLNVDRVVFVDVLEYRLNPPGNRWLWEGVAVSRVGIIERNGLDPDAFAQTFDVASKFPNMEGVTRESATEAQVATGLLTEFVKHNAWLFHLHYEPKHPDQYKPTMDTKQMQEMKRATGS